MAGAHILCTMSIRDTIKGPAYPSIDRGCRAFDSVTVCCDLEQQCSWPKVAEPNWHPVCLKCSFALLHVGPQTVV